MDLHPNAATDALDAAGGDAGDAPAPHRLATDALVHVAFERLDAPFVVAGCLAANDRSRRAIESFARRYGGAYAGSPPTVSDHRDDDAMAPRHEWVVTREAFDAGDRGLSTLVPGVEYEDLAL